MRILVAGWHGQIAMALSEAAARRHDIEAYAVGRPALDLTDRPTIGRTLFGIAPDVIINTAAYTDVEGAELEPDLAFRRNTQGAEALAGQAARISVPIIHLSTVYVFDGEKQTAYLETDPANPINEYGRSKLAGEAAVARANPRHIILRTGWVYSPFGRNFITNVLERAAGKPELNIDNTQQGSPTYAPHLANTILDVAACLTAKPAAELWGTFHAADTGTARWSDLAHETFKVASEHGIPAPHITAAPLPPRPGTARRPLNARLDCNKLNAAFGTSQPAWQDAVRDCVNRIHSLS